MALLQRNVFFTTEINFWSCLRIGYGRWSFIFDKLKRFIRYFYFKTRTENQGCLRLLNRPYGYFYVDRSTLLGKRNFDVPSRGFCARPMSELYFFVKYLNTVTVLQYCDRFFSNVFKNYNVLPRCYYFEIRYATHNIKLIVICWAPTDFVGFMWILYFARLQL